MKCPALLALLLLGCAAEADPRGLGPEPGQPREQVGFAVCTDAPPPAATKVSSFRHTSSTLISFASAWHTADDVVTTDEADATVRAKLAYGSLSKDLEDEWVEVFLDDCETLVRLGRARTDDDGRIALTLPWDRLPGAGQFALHLRVEGDGTLARASLWVLPVGTRLAVFDIDGTLTTSDWELFEDLLDDLFRPILAGTTPDARAGAAPTTRARAAQGYIPVYLTGRPYWLTGKSRAWLEAQGMAAGPVITARRTAQILPTQSGVGAFKADTLAELEWMGLLPELAYGNATTDIAAYAEAGIELASTFILGRHGGEGGTVALGDDYEAHLEHVDLSAIAQPFARP